MGFLGYCAIIWLCFPPWPYMYAGCGGEQGTDSLSELVLLVCIAWLPSALASFSCLRLPRGNEVRESFSVTRKITAAPVVYPEEEEGAEGVCVCLWHSVRASKSNAVGSPCRGPCGLLASRHSFRGAVIKDCLLLVGSV